MLYNLWKRPDLYTYNDRAVDSIYFNHYIDSWGILGHIWVALINLQKKLIRVGHKISSTTFVMNNMPNDTIVQASSGIIWLTNTYNLNVLQMANGNLISSSGNDQYRNISNDTKSMYYEDLMYISHEAMKMKLYSTAIKIFGASILLYKGNQCLFRSTTNHCRPYIFDTVKSWYISKHNFELLNPSERKFDSAVFYPHQIRDGWFDFLRLIIFKLFFVLAKHICVVYRKNDGKHLCA